MPLRSAVAVAASAIMMAALCGCGSEEAASQSETPATSSSASSTVPPQPEGPSGYTVDIANWDEYYDDPVVLAVKDFVESYGASFNSGKIHQALKHNTNKKVLRTLTGIMRKAWKADRHLPDVNRLRVDSVDVDGDDAKVTACVLYISFLQRESDGKLMDEDKNVDKNEWRVETFNLHKTESRWKAAQMPTIKNDTCVGEEGESK